MTDADEILTGISIEAIAKILMFRGLHLLCTMDPTTNKLKAAYIASCLSYGRSPVWGVFTLDGEPRRFFGSKAKVAEGFPRHVWRTFSSQWALRHVEKQPAMKREEEVKEHYKATRKGAEAKPVSAHAPVLH